MKNSTALVISQHGGGGRGYYTACWMERFVNLWGIPANEIGLRATVLGGTSAGSQAVVAYGLGKTPVEVKAFIREHAPWVCTVRTAADIAIGLINASLPSNKPSWLQKSIMLGLGNPFYQPVSESSNYGSARLKTALTSMCGTNTLQALNTNVIIPSYQRTNKRFVYFSNVDDVEYFGKDTSLVNAAMASSAADYYFPTVTIDGIEYSDGGLFDNSTVAQSVSLAQKVKPTYQKLCILSVGTGLGEVGFHGYDGSGTEEQNKLAEAVAKLDVAITGAQEVQEKAMRLSSAGFTLDNRYYNSTQPLLDLGVDTELDSTTDVVFEYLEELAETEFNNNISAISTFIGHIES